MIYHRENWLELMNAIIVRACDDYRAALKVLNEDPENSSAKYRKRECENFFRGELFEALTDLNPEILIRRMREEV